MASHDIKVLVYRECFIKEPEGLSSFWAVNGALRSLKNLFLEQLLS